VEGGITHEPANAVPRRLPTRRPVDHRAVRAMWVNVSIVCVGEYVGLEEIDDGIWTVYFGPLRLGRLLERRMRIEDEYARLYRHGHV
jgi:hypothetical protein